MESFVLYRKTISRNDLNSVGLEIHLVCIGQRPSMRWIFCARAESRKFCSLSPPPGHPPTRDALLDLFTFLFPGHCCVTSSSCRLLRGNFLSGRKLVASTTFCCVKRRKMCKSDIKPLRSRSEVNKHTPRSYQSKRYFRGKGHPKDQKVPAVSSVIEKPQPKFSQQEAISLRCRKKKFASSKTSDSELRAWSLLRRFHYANMLQVVC